MATELLAVGTGITIGAEFTLTDTTLVFLKAGDGNAIPSNVSLAIQGKGSTGKFADVIRLDWRNSSVPLPAGTYRPVRLKGPGSLGLERM